MKWLELAAAKDGLFFSTLCKGVVGIWVHDTSHLAVRRIIYNTEGLISNERGNLEGEDREFVNQKG